jgi:Tfp pilus assembly protein PilF
MPEFSGANEAGRVFVHKHGQAKVSMVVFLSAGQEGSDRAAADIKGITGALEANSSALQTVIVLCAPNGDGYFQSDQKQQAKDFHVVVDKEYKLWGKFGITATPTVVISDTNDNVVWVKPGYGYDFHGSVRRHLYGALGLIDKKQVEQSAQVRTLAIDTVQAKAQMHVKMAEILERKGLVESAVLELRKARQLDPNSVEVTLELGRLHCKLGESEKVVALVAQVQTDSRKEKAATTLLLGWANRQMGKIEAAEKLLLEAVRLDPKSSRAIFELGKTYQLRGQAEKAMQTYYKALAIIFSEPTKIDSSRKR